MYREKFPRHPRFVVNPIASETNDVQLLICMLCFDQHNTPEADVIGRAFHILLSASSWNIAAAVDITAEITSPSLHPFGSSGFSRIVARIGSFRISEFF